MPRTRQEEEREPSTEGDRSGDEDRVFHIPDTDCMARVRKLIAWTAEWVERQENGTRIGFWEE